MRIVRVNEFLAGRIKRTVQQCNVQCVGGGERQWTVIGGGSRQLRELQKQRFVSADCRVANHLLLCSWPRTHANHQVSTSSYCTSRIAASYLHHNSFKLKYISICYTHFSYSVAKNYWRF